MASNVLTATIKVNTQGVKQSFQETGTAAKKAAVDIKGIGGFATGAIAETKQVIKSLTAELSGLDAKLLASKGGRALSSELSLAKNELKQLEKQAAITGTNTGNSLTKGFGALRQLAYILPGIGIAGILNIATEAVGKFIESFSALPRSAATVVEFNEKFAAGAGKSIANIELLKAKINDSNTTQSQRVELVKDYNKEADRGNQIDIKQIGNIDLINEKIAQQISLLKERAKVKAAENVIAGKFEELFKRELDFQIKFPGFNEAIAKATTTVEAANEKLKIKPKFDVKELLALVDLPKAQLDNLAKGADRLKALGDPEVVRRLQNANKELSAFFNTVGGKQSFTSSGAKIFLDDARKDVDDTLALFGKLLTIDGFSEAEKVKIAKFFEAIHVGIVKGLNDTVKLLELNPNKLSVPFQLALDEAKLTVQFSALNEELRSKLNQFALKASVVPIVIRQQIEVDPNITIAPKNIRDEINRELQSQMGDVPLKLDANGDIEVDVNGNVKIDTAKLRQDAQKEIAKAFEDIKVGIATGIGEALGDAISGKGLEGLFKNVLGVISDGMRAIGVALIKYGVKMQAVKVALNGILKNPAVAIALGIALVALSQALKNSIGGGREKGGPVTKGKTYEVNERGQEIFQPTAGKPFLITGGRQLFSPPTSGKIIPHKETEKILKTASVSKVKESFHKSLVKISGYRATGGNVTHGNNYVVNENGKEIFQTISGKAMVIQGGKQVFTPPVSGKIISHSETKKILNNFSSLKSNTSRVVNNISSSIRNISGHRAGGGPVVAGNNYVVNERGTEIFIPNTGRAINFNQPATTAQRGGISVMVTGGVEISGNKLIAVLANAGRNQKVFV